MNDRISRIRESERVAHIEMYTSTDTPNINSWLNKPARVVQEILPQLERRTNLRVLDLGCGIGRNSIFIAEKCKSTGCSIDCIDLLEVAIDRLRENTQKHGVGDNIHGVVSSIEGFKIMPESYDLILAVSALEHVDSKRSFVQKLKEIRNGLSNEGVACFMINSNVREVELASGEELEPQFEVRFSDEEVLEILDDVFSKQKVIGRMVNSQEYDVPRGSTPCHLYTDVVTYVIQNSAA